MSARKPDPRTLLALALLLVIAGCGGGNARDWINTKPIPTGGAPTIRIVGTVHHLELEGGIYVIRDSTGTQYLAGNLPRSLQFDGIEVEADARRLDNVATIGMVGPVVTLVRIRRLPE